MTHLILIRHGDTQWTREKRYQGHTDLELLPDGRRAIRRLALGLKAARIDVLYTSALKRARESAEILAREAGIKPRLDARLREVSFGRWEGKTAKDLIRGKDPYFLSWLKGKWVTPPGAETFALFRKRVKAFLAACLKKHPNQKVALVTHGGPIRMMVCEALRFPKEFYFTFRIDPASFSILSVNGRKGMLSCLNVKSVAAKSLKEWIR